MNASSGDGTAGGALESGQVLTAREIGREVTLRIGRQTLRFVADGRLRFFLHENHLPFLVSDAATPDCEVRWTIAPLKRPTAPVFRRFEQRWEVRRQPDGGEEITFYNPIGDGLELEPAMQIVSDAEFRSLVVRQAPRGGDPVAYVSEYPWAEYITQRRLGLHSGAMLHASTAVFAGVAYLFMGHSGAGKSTIAEIAERMGASIPTDDRTILTVDERGVTAWGTPWHGSFRRSSAEGSPVGSISLLVQDTIDRLGPLDPGRAVKEMFVRTVQARITEREVHRTLETLESVVARVPCHELRFRPTPAAVELVIREGAAAFSGAGNRVR